MNITELSRRDYFAAHAMQEIIARDSINPMMDDDCKVAYQWADAMIAGADKQQSQPLTGETCIWREQESGESWETGCGTAYVFFEEGPTANGFKVCPFCAKKIAEKRPEPKPEEKELDAAIAQSQPLKTMIDALASAACDNFLPSPINPLFCDLCYRPLSDHLNKASVVSAPADDVGDGYVRIDKPERDTDEYAHIDFLNEWYPVAKLCMPWWTFNWVPGTIFRRKVAVKEPEIDFDQWQNKEQPKRELWATLDFDGKGDPDNMTSLKRLTLDMILQDEVLFGDIQELILSYGIHFDSAKADGIKNMTIKDWLRDRLEKGMK